LKRLAAVRGDVAVDDGDNEPAAASDGRRQRPAAERM
jgi:hypothetical protein